MRQKEKRKFTIKWGGGGRKEILDEIGKRRNLQSKHAEKKENLMKWEKKTGDLESKFWI